MRKMITALCVLAVAVGSMMAVNGTQSAPSLKQQKKTVVLDRQTKGGPAVGQTSPAYDQSVNGFGWLGQKINAIAYDPATDVFASFYRKKAAAGSGTLGGMVGVYDPAEANPIVCTTETIQNQVAGQWNLRYCSIEQAADGFFYGAGTSLMTGWPDSPQIFVVYDPNSGWKFRKIDLVSFNMIRPTIATYKNGNVYGVKIIFGGTEDGNTVVPSFTGTTTTPADINSWVFVKDTFPFPEDQYTSPHFKIQDNGVGLLVQQFKDPVTDDEYLHYKWTSNHGATWSTVDSLSAAQLAPFITVPPQTVGGGNPLTIANMGSFVEMVMEKNGNAHVLLKLDGTDTPGSMYRATDSGTPLNGYYHVAFNWNGSGYTIPKANFIAQPNGWDADKFPEVDGEKWFHGSSNLQRANIGLALNAEGTKQVIYAGWPDRAEGVNIRTNAPKPGVSVTGTSVQELFVGDGFMTYSEDNGLTWKHAIDSSWTAYNVTNSAKKSSTPVHENSFTIARSGKLVPAANGLFDLVTYAGFQVPDWDIPGGSVENVEDFQMSLHVNRITANLVTGFNDIEEVPMYATEFELAQNYPNPFNPTTAINFNLQAAANVKLSVFNAQGQEVANLINAKMVSGAHTANFNAANLNSGVYFYKLSVDGQSAVKKMVLTK